MTIQEAHDHLENNTEFDTVNNDTDCEAIEVALLCIEQLMESEEDS